MLIRVKTGKSKAIVFLAHVETTSTKYELLKPEWEQAMKLEYYALIVNQTWTLTNIPPHR